jgi:hypothetical protein
MMCSGKGIRHWITHSPITPLDSSAASRFASVLLEPTIASSAEFPSHGDRAHLPFRRNPRVPRVRQAGLFEIEMMAEFMA